MFGSTLAPAKVSLSLPHRIRLAIVSALVVLAVVPVGADFVRAFQPLGEFGYATNGDGIVVVTPAKPIKGSDRIERGDRVRVDRIKPFDRKPGLAGVGFTIENFDRHLPIERAGKERVLHLVAAPEPVASRATAVLRILIFVASVLLGAILFLIKPSIATAGLFLFCLGGEYPITYTAADWERPWRELPLVISNLFRGAAAPSLFLFAFCTWSASPILQRKAAIACGAAALLLSGVHAYAVWALPYAARHVESLNVVFGMATNFVIGLTTLAFAFAFLQAREVERTRTGIILVGFLVSAAAHLISAALFPAHLSPLINGLLQTAPIVPIVLVWVAVLRHRFFEVDFMVSRGIVFVALGVGLVGVFAVIDEMAGYLTYNNLEFWAGILSTMVMVLGMFFGKVLEFCHRFIDRFIFPDRNSQRVALELISGYVLDAETIEDVHRALLEDAPHALKLSFGGLFTRRPDGGFELTEERNWPSNVQIRFDSQDPFLKAINRTRGALNFDDKEWKKVRKSFHHEHLTFAAPLFFERSVSSIVVYGKNVSGLDLDPDEREMLVRLVEHASIAINAIELGRYRAALSAVSEMAAGAT